jgi:hypothetical protein
VSGRNIRVCPVKRGYDPVGVLSRTEAVVPKYLKLYSMQVNMPKQKDSLFEPKQLSVRLHPKTAPAIDAVGLIIRRRVNQTLTAAIAKCFGKII